MRGQAAGSTGPLLLSAALLTAGSLAGCKSPQRWAFDGDEPGRAETAAAARAAIDRELTASRADPADEAPSLWTTQPPGEVDEAVARSRERLEAITPSRGVEAQVDLGTDLEGLPQREVRVSLRNAIHGAALNNLAVKSASLQPAITEASLQSAQAAFDWLLYGDGSFTKTDEPSTATIIGGNIIGASVRGNEQWRLDTGLKKRFDGGGQFTISTDLSRSEDRTPGIEVSPDPAYEAAVRLGFTQPLLREFGAESARSTIRLAANARAAADEQLHATLLDVAKATEETYWNLVIAWRALEIRQWLLDEGVKVRDVLKGRMDFDVELAEYADAVARVESRRADVIRARRQVRAGSDALKKLINDPDLAVGSEAIVRPVDALIDAPLEYRLHDLLASAIDRRPEIRQALLATDDATIRAEFADSGRLPKLDLTLQTAYLGMGNNFGEAYEQANEGSFIDYVVGLAFERPLANRAPESEYRKARLERAQAVVRYRQTVQDVVIEVKSALRDVVTNYELIRATRSSRLAAAQNLQALQDKEETLANLTPEFLNLKFQRQEALAAARTEEFAALAAFDTALAALHRATGQSLERNGLELEFIRAEQQRDLSALLPE